MVSTPDCAEYGARVTNPGQQDPACRFQGAPNTSAHCIPWSQRETQDSKVWDGTSFTHREREKEREGKDSYYSVPWSLKDDRPAMAAYEHSLCATVEGPLSRESEILKVSVCVWGVPEGHELTC